MPFLGFYLTGMALEAAAPYALKALMLLALYGALHAAAHALLSDELRNIFPLSVYLATKVGVRAGGCLPVCLRALSPRSRCRCGSTSRGWCSWRAWCRARPRRCSC